MFSVFNKLQENMGLYNRGSYKIRSGWDEKEMV